MNVINWGEVVFWVSAFGAGMMCVSAVCGVFEERYRTLAGKKPEIDADERARKMLAEVTKLVKGSK